jgi:hypothetical protein
VVLLGLAFLFTLMSELSTPSHSGRHRDDEELFISIFGGFLLPVGLAVVLIMYHRLLGAARRAVLDGAPEQVTD